MHVPRTASVRPGTYRVPGYIQCSDLRYVPVLAGVPGPWYLVFVPDTCTTSLIPGTDYDKEPRTRYYSVDTLFIPVEECGEAKLSGQQRVGTNLFTLAV